MIPTGEALTNTATDLLIQLQGVLEELDDKLYAQKTDLLSGASIGAHVRHSLEFFSCLLEEANFGEVNYDLRKRDLEIESSTEAAAIMVKDIIEGLSNVSSDTSINLSTKLFGESGAEVSLTTSLHRELWYTIEHAIHHFAIIKMGIKNHNSSFKFPENFGVASSTMIHQMSE